MVPSFYFAYPPAENHRISISKEVLNTGWNYFGVDLKNKSWEDEGIIVICMEIIPRVLRVSFERVCSMEETLKCLSISLTHGKYIRY